MRHHIGLYPQPGDEPRGYMGGSAGDIPVVELDARAELAFHLDLDDAVGYLDHLADEASSLAAKIRRRQQQTGEARLLTSLTPVIRADDDRDVPLVGKIVGYEDGDRALVLWGDAAITGRTEQACVEALDELRPHRAKAVSS